MCNHNQLTISDKHFIKRKMCNKRKCGTTQKGVSCNAKHGISHRNLPPTMASFAVKKNAYHGILMCEFV